MQAVAGIVRAVFRMRVRGWVALALLGGVFGGIALGAGVGAHRTSTAVDRFVAWGKPPDVFFAPRFTMEAPPEVLERFETEDIRRWPVVRDVARIDVIPTGGVEVATADGAWRRLDEDPDLNHMADARIGHDLFGYNLLTGRRVRHDVPGEVLVNEVAYRRHGLAPGSKVRVRVLSDSPWLGENVREVATVELDVVGVALAATDLGGGPYATMSASAATPIPDGVVVTPLNLVWLHGGERGLATFRTELEQRNGGQPAMFIEARTSIEQSRRSVGLQATALLLLAGFLALLTAMIFGQTLARQTFLESADDPVLRALGATRGQLFAVSMARAAFVAVPAAVLAVAIAVLVSPFAPIGTARRAEVDPGLWAPAGPLLLGAATIVGAVLLLAVVPAWRAAAARTRSAEERQRPSMLASAFSRMSPNPASIAGVRMALEPGRGHSAVPVRTTLTGAVLAVLALVATAIAGSSLARLAETPAHYGWTWDVAVRGDGDELREALPDVPGVAAASYGNLGGILVLDEVSTGVILMDPGPVRMPVLEGRAPVAGDEVAVGRKTLRALGVDVGATVNAGIQGFEGTRRVRVVGVAVLPLTDDATSLGEGVWVTTAFVRGFIPDFANDTAFVRFSRSADARAVEAALVARFGEEAFERPVPPNGVVDFGRVRAMPWILAGVVAALAAATLAHGLVTAVRRRRRDLAIFKTLGFTRGQVRSAIAWQATVLVLVTLVVAAPLGVAAGRWLWTFFANQNGFVSMPAVDVRLLLIVPAMLALANLLALVPGRSASNTEPATTLRTE